MDTHRVAGTSPEIRSLDAVLAFESTDVVERFMEHFAVSRDEAKLLFDDTKRWCWLCATATMERRRGLPGVPERLVIDDALIMVDEMWHNFICWTELYSRFCLEFFGFFVHHFPTPHRVKGQLQEEVRRNPSIQADRRRVRYHYICDKLGKETLVRWYVEYPARYSVEVIRTLRRR